MNRLTITALVLSGIGCVEEATIPPFPAQVIPATISTSDTDLQPGETATITVTLTNTLDEDIQLTFPTQCQALVFIRNSEGRVTTPENGSWECASVPSSVNIAIGKSATYHMEWGGGIEFGPAGTSPRVPPGSYLASGELRADGYHAIAFPITIVVR